MNEQENNNLPELRPAQEIYAERLRPYWLDPREDYPEPYYMLQYKGVPFSALGGLQAISGQKKNGKTFVLTQLMAAVLGRGTARVRQYLPGLECPQRTIDYLGHEPTVLFVDTEMEKLYSAKVLRRVHWLCGWEMNVPNDRFHVLWLRSVKTDDERQKIYEKRYQLIKMAIEVTNPDFVVIDGLRDIIGDINDGEKASELISELSALAEQRRMCVWLALHLNPRPGNEQESKMRGWLGTELGNKVSDTLIGIKKKQGADVTFTVKQDDARNKDMEDWQYSVTDAAGALGIPRIFGTPISQETQEMLDADALFKSYNWTSSGATYTDLEKFIRNKGVTSNRKMSGIFNTAMECGIIYKDAKKKYHYKGIEKPTPNDQSQDLPFGPAPDEECPF